MPQKAHVTLLSAEGYEFVIDYKAACVSNTIRNMLSSSGLVKAWCAFYIGSLAAARLSLSLSCSSVGSFTETEKGEIKFPEISTQVLEKVCQYFYYKLRYQNS